MIAGLLAIPVTIRGLGTERFGLLSLVWVVVGYFGLFDLGLGPATTKFVADAIGKSEFSRLNTVVWTSLCSVACLGLSAGLLLALLGPFLTSKILRLPVHLRLEANASLLIISVGFPLILASGVFRGALAGLNRFDLINSVQTPASVLIYACPAVGALLNLGLTRIVLLLVLVRAAAVIALVLFCYRCVPGLRLLPSIDRRLLHRLFGFGSWVTVSSILGPILGYADRLMVGRIVSISALAYYTVPQDMAGRLAILPGSMSSALFPALASLSGAGDTPKQHVIFCRSLKVVLIASFSVVLPLFILANTILRLWLGSNFARESAVVLRIVAVGMLANALAYVAVSLLQAVGRPDLSPKFHALQIVLYAPLLYWLSRISFV
jgi:O-antigen/teichoic acid export membrane protein